MDEKLFVPHVERFDNLLQEMKDLETSKQKALLSFRKHFIECLSDQIKTCAGQKFAFTAKGTYKITLAYGKIKNQESEVSFNFTFVGKIMNQNNGFPDFKPDYDYSFIHDSAFVLPWKEMYIFDPLGRGLAHEGFVHATLKQQLHIWTVGSQEPSWHIHNLMKKYVSEEVYKSILVYPQWACDLDTQVELFIGDEEYKIFKESCPEHIQNILPI